VCLSVFECKFSIVLYCIVYLDRTLTFGHHVKVVPRKASAHCRVVSSLAGKSWGWKKSNFRQFYQALITPVMNYAAAGWQPWLSKSRLEELERTQNRALHIIMGQNRTTSVETLRAEASVESYSTTSRQLCAIAFEKAKLMPADHPRRVALDWTTAHHLGRNSWRKLSQEIMDTMAEELSSCDIEDLYINPPLSFSLGNWKVELVPPVDPDEAGHTSSFDHNNPVGSAQDVFRDGGAGLLSSVVT